jgi:flagellar biosynthesis chaperone FliJ
MEIPKYPLSQVVEIKERRVEEAEKVLKEKLEALQKEEEKLKLRKAEEEKVQTHYKEKLSQMREEMDGGTTSSKIEQMRVYLKIVVGQWEAEKKKVKEQEEHVKTAEKTVELARKELNQKQIDVEKIKMHQKEWSKGERKAALIKETQQHDELGSIVHGQQRKST